MKLSSSFYVTLGLTLVFAFTALRLIKDLRPIKPSQSAHYWSSLKRKDKKLQSARSPASKSEQYQTELALPFREFSRQFAELGLGTLKLISGPKKIGKEKTRDLLIRIKGDTFQGIHQDIEIVLTPFSLKTKKSSQEGHFLGLKIKKFLVGRSDFSKNRLYIEHFLSQISGSEVFANPYLKWDPTHERVRTSLDQGVIALNWNFSQILSTHPQFERLREKVERISFESFQALQYKGSREVFFKIVFSIEESLDQTQAVTSFLFGQLLSIENEKSD